MNRVILFFILLLTQLQADDFTQFLQIALQNNPSLQTAKLQAEQIKLKTKTLYRYENPNFAGSLAKYDDKDGFSMGFSQKIPLPDIRKELKKLSDIMIQKIHISYQLKKATLIKNLSLKYLEYIKKRDFARLAQKESDLAKKIYNISKSRYKTGTIAKSKLLQAKLAYHQSLQNEKKLLLEKERGYYDLLLESGIMQAISLEKRHHFSVQPSTKQNLALMLLLLDKKLSQAKTRTSTKTIDSYELLAEYEQEPEQNIIRLGISLPMPLFHQKDEEKKIAALAIQEKHYTLEKFQQKLSLLKEKYIKEHLLLQELQRNNQHLLKEQKKMLEMFEEGYKIANINLLELQNIKNALIQTQKEQITIQTELDQNIIYQNYLNGAYHD
jgi:cobalt-zinc-cadmium efflux system outer membrane protein